MSTCAKVKILSLFNSEMGNLLGGKNKSRVTDLDRAVLGLKKQRDELKRAQKRIEVNFANKSKKFQQSFCRLSILTNMKIINFA